MIVAELTLSSERDLALNINIANGREKATGWLAQSGR
jgi:hypothetical protein